MRGLAIMVCLQALCLGGDDQWRLAFLSVLLCKYCFERSLKLPVLFTSLFGASFLCSNLLESVELLG